MTGFMQAARRLLCVTAMLALAGCGTVEESVASLRDSITEINFPSLLSSGEETQARTEIAVTDTTNTGPAVIAAEKPAAVDAETILAATENCPSVSIIDELKTLSQFTDMDVPSKDNFISSVTIKDAISGCSYSDDNVVLQMNIHFEGEIGIGGRVANTGISRISYPYFIAITSPQGNILSKEVHALSINYGAGEMEKAQEERLRQIIPLTGESFGPDHEILIGMQLTPAQLAYNRQQKEEVENMVAAVENPANVKNLADIQPAAGGDDAPPLSASARSVTAPATAFQPGIQQPSQNTVIVPASEQTEPVAAQAQQEVQYPVYLYDRTFGY